MLLIKSFSYLYRIWFSAKVTFAVTYKFILPRNLVDINFLFRTNISLYLYFNNFRIEKAITGEVRKGSNLLHEYPYYII